MRIGRNIMEVGARRGRLSNPETSEETAWLVASTGLAGCLRASDSAPWFCPIGCLGLDGAVISGESFPWSAQPQLATLVQGCPTSSP